MFLAQDVVNAMQFATVISAGQNQQLLA